MRTHTYPVGQAHISGEQRIDQIVRQTATTIQDLLLFGATLIVAGLVMGGAVWVIAACITILRALPNLM